MTKKARSLDTWRRSSREKERPATNLKTTTKGYIFISLAFKAPGVMKSGLGYQYTTNPEGERPHYKQIREETGDGREPDGRGVQKKIPLPSMKYG